MAYFSDRLVSANKLIIAASAIYAGAVTLAHADTMDDANLAVTSCEQARMTVLTAYGQAKYTVDIGARYSQAMDALGASISRALRTRVAISSGRTDIEVRGCDGALVVNYMLHERGQ
jgi:hypothetical protein